MPFTGKISKAVKSTTVVREVAQSEIDNGIQKIGDIDQIREAISNNASKRIDPRGIVVAKPRQRPEETVASPDTPNLPSTEQEAASQAPTPVNASASRSLFLPYSLLGHASTLAINAAEAKPILGKFIIQGQATMIYAAPNTGKTLILIYLCLVAIAREIIEAKCLYYINADDSSHGLAAKAGLMQDVGAHMLAPGLRGFRTGDLARLLIQSAEEGSALGICIIIDTLKKFTDLMDKKRSSEFAQACRQFVMAGGTIVALGHTTKNPNADGSPRPQGTNDILEDFDAVYVAQPMTSKLNAAGRVVQFTRKKSRADTPETVAYAYSADPGIGYDAKLASVRPIDPDDMDDYAIEEDIDPPQVMDAIVRLIKAGSVLGKMALSLAVSKELGISHKAAIGVLERHTGTVPNKHLWNFDKGPRGVRIYRLIDQTRPDS